MHLLRSTVVLCAIAATVLAGCAQPSPQDPPSVATRSGPDFHSIDGQLDCGAGAITWAVQAAFVAGATGAATRDEALRQELTRYRAEGDRLRIEAGIGTVISGDREVVRARVEQLPESGGFVANPVSGCEGDKVPR